MGLAGEVVPRYAHCSRYGLIDGYWAAAVTAACCAREGVQLTWCSQRVGDGA